MLTQRNTFGETFLDIALRARNERVLDVLRYHGFIGIASF
jgi:hypothetical protein